MNNGKLYVEGEPLVFFHFSGFIIDNIEKISKHQNRFTLKDFPNLLKLFDFYKKSLLQNNFINFTKKQYFFSKLPTTNITIPESLRKNYREVLKLGNPWNPNSLDRICEMIPNRKDCVNATQINSSIGVNLIGYFKNIFGVAETIRSLFYSIRETGLPFTLYNISSNDHKYLPEEEIEEFSKWFTDKNIYKINIININADTIPKIYNYYQNVFKNKYNIGIWAWELQDYFPFARSFDYVDEVWYYSDFACSEYRKHTSKPVNKIIYPFRPMWKYVIPKEEMRRRFRIPQDYFVFFFAFDFHSSFERKNPDGIIKAYLKAFNTGKENTILVIKTLHKEFYPEEYDVLLNLVKGRKDILLIDGELSKEEHISLMNASDCFVSLHRSEGLGIGILEAMYLKKCVIATSYGGNMEFTTPENSLLVEYTLSPIKNEFGPYKKGILWAEPSIEQCAEYMKFVYENPYKAEEIAKKGKFFLEQKTKTASWSILKRLSELS
ncbi:MAG: glycosyltransferase [Candidatus Parvarchaeota archaeon]